MFLFCLCPQILLRQFPDTFFRRPKREASLSVRTGRVRMKIHSVPFSVSSSLKTRFASKNANILDPKQKRRKKRSLETQGRHTWSVCFFLGGVHSLPGYLRLTGPSRSRRAYFFFGVDLVVGSRRSVSFCARTRSSLQGSWQFP